MLITFLCLLDLRGSPLLFSYGYSLARGSDICQVEMEIFGNEFVTMVKVQIGHERRGLSTGYAHPVDNYWVAKGFAVGCGVAT